MPALLAEKPPERGETERSFTLASSQFGFVKAVYWGAEVPDFLTLVESCREDLSFWKPDGEELNGQEITQLLQEYFRSDGYDVLQGGPEGEFGKRGIGVWEDVWVAKLTTSEGEEKFYCFSGDLLLTEGSQEYSFMRIAVRALEDLERMGPPAAMERQAYMVFPCSYARQVYVRYNLPEGMEASQADPKTVFENFVDLTVREPDGQRRLLSNEELHELLGEMFSGDVLMGGEGNALGRYGVGEEFHIVDYTAENFQRGFLVLYNSPEEGARIVKVDSQEGLAVWARTAYNMWARDNR